MPDLRQLLDEAAPRVRPAADVDNLWRRAQRQRTVRRTAIGTVLAFVVLGAGLVMADLGRTSVPTIGGPEDPSDSTPVQPESDPTTATTSEMVDPAAMLDDAFGSAWRDHVVLYTDGNNRINAVRLDGTDNRLLTHGRTKVSESGWDLDPRLSPDGSQIAFHRERLEDGGEIWISRADGSDARRITDLPPDTVGVQPTWTPDGSHLVYVRVSENGAKTDLHIIAVDGNDDRYITPGFNPEISSDGTQIVYENEGAIWITSIDGQETPREVVTDGLDPAWSPDGARIAYATGDGSTVRIVNVDGTGDRAVTGANERPMTKRSNVWWSADGRLIMAVSASKLVLVEVDGDLRIPLPLREQWCLTWWRPTA